HAVLSLSPSKAEWLEYGANGEPRYACADVVGTGVDDFAHAAIEARTRAGGKLHRCRLALAEGLVTHKLLAIPSLGKRELRGVLERKTASTRATDEFPIFAGVDVGPAQDGARNWLVLSMERDFTESLLIRLRRARLHVRGVVSATLAGLRRSDEFRTEDGKATLVITVSHEAVEVSLVSGDQLVSSDTLDGDLRENPQLVTGLLQLARTAAAFWRKSQRGAEVAAAHIIGMPPERGGLLSQAVATALPGTRVQCDPGTDAPDPEAGRIALLASCSYGGPLAIDVNVPLPPPRLVAAAGLAACAASLLLGFGIVQRAVEEPRAHLLNEIATLQGESADLDILERKQSAVGDSMHLIEQRMGRAVQIGADAPDYAEVMASVLDALHGRAQLLSISVTSGMEGKHELRFSAATTSSPLNALRVAREIEVALASDPTLSEVVLELPTTFEADDATGGFPIDVRATCEARR
ncbi:MAG: hypothetical protein KDC14_05230, partial [Planctomycetes bacterium]|nr:hypothetical protein [Planctomycetota bacterium]